MLLTLALLLSGCSEQAAISTDPTITPTAAAQNPSKETGELFSARDLDPSYDESKSAHITLLGDSAQCSSNAVMITGSTVTITDEGTYLLSGALDSGMVIVNADKADKIQLVFSGVSIHSESSAAVYIAQADKVFLTLAPGTENTLTNGNSYTPIDDSNIDSAVFSKEDLTINGTGSLTVNSPAGHGIVSKDSLVITGGTYHIDAALHGISGKDDVCLTNANITVTSGKDGIHAENEDDEQLGCIYIQSGAYNITAGYDGIAASSWMQILGGSFSVVAGGGSENGAFHGSDTWGGGMGGFMGGGMRPGGSPGGKASGNEPSSDTETDTVSTKAIKAGGDLSICDGTFIIDSADDAVHSNTNVTVSGGSFTIASGDDAFHADETLTVTGGSIQVSESYEGLEGLHILISGGEISLVASDDGLNAAGGTDQSGFGGPMGNDRFGGGKGGGMGQMGSSDGSIEISGGTLYITASGDGIDANGTLTISGGYTTVCGPNMGDTATLDYDITATITGGTFIGTGASGMAQTFSHSEQGVVAVSVGNQSADTLITLTDANGTMILSYTPNMAFGVVILSSPEIIKGNTYTITVGQASGSFAAQ